jgi:hypothetical protein
MRGLGLGRIVSRSEAGILGGMSGYLTDLEMYLSLLLNGDGCRYNN